MCGQPIISLQNITVRDLDIREGEHVAIIGANGAGKSTLVQVMSEEVHPVWAPDSERLLFGSARWKVLELRKRMGIVSAALQYLCTTSYPARHIVLSGFFSSIGLDFHHQVTAGMEKSAELRLEQQGILHVADKAMRNLSSGEARRVLLAPVHDPQVMLLDEAVSNLDMPAKKSYRQSLETFAREGRTIILVTHDLSEIIGEIGRVIIMKQGRILADGAKRDILTEQLLSEAYGTRVFLSEREGRFNAWC